VIAIDFDRISSPLLNQPPHRDPMASPHLSDFIDRQERHGRVKVLTVAD